jgi:hypothetical protein
MKYLKCYLSGRKTVDEDSQSEFAEAEQLCKKCFTTVTNPCKWYNGKNHIWIWYAIHDVWQLCHNGYSHIIMLDSWQDSSIAKIEYFFAKHNHIDIISIKNIKQLVKDGNTLR